MKKIFAFLFLVLMMSGQSVSAAIVNSLAEGEFQEYINKTGFKILNANGIDKRIVFRYSSDSSLRTSSLSKDKSVIIPKGVIMYVEAEDELAAAIAYQIAYCLNYHESKFANINIKLSPKKYELLADKRAVDFLVKANYSPLSMIIMINKLYGDEKSSKYNKPSVRMANIYEYIVRKYPEKLDNRRYNKNLYYQNFLLNSRYNRELLDNQLRDNPTANINFEYR